MPNSFLGFPVPRAKIADMIAAAAPPSLHHAQHENGGSDEIDATGLTGAGGSGIGIKDFFIFTSSFESLDGYLQNTAGTGTITLDHPCVILDTGLLATGEARLYKDMQAYFPFPNWGKDAVFSLYATFDSNTSNNGRFRIFCGDSVDFGQIGFEVEAGVLYGMCAKSSAHATVALQTLGAGSYYEFRFLQAVFTAGSKVEFYVDGVLKGEITTNLPTVTEIFTTFFSAEVNNLSFAQSKILYLTSFNFVMKLF